ncbi:mitochondrial ribosomal protein [Blumeria hordei DH14]|uniref:Large ribosomal subunit protein mL43 n=1 Tax=Blumeria graminis f. sp. hordei (strain DH14) TaxID=546991 RepID=N1J526_BLUG1|nr:mitochondrial ribosomal protein [Blumeria hordei DH14]
MPVLGIRKTTISQNGTAGAFILACKRIDFHYCDFWGSSRGMNRILLTSSFSLFLKYNLQRFAAANPQVEITVSPRPNRHPVVIGHYINGRHKAICVRNLDEAQILKKVDLLRDANGEKLKKVIKPVQSLQESVRGIWSPYHGAGLKV